MLLTLRLIWTCMFPNKNIIESVKQNIFFNGTIKVNYLNLMSGYGTRHKMSRIVLPNILHGVHSKPTDKRIIQFQVSANVDL